MRMKKIGGDRERRFEKIREERDLERVCLIAFPFAVSCF